MDERYSAQTALGQIGPEGQKKLAAASVVVVGAGGLGSPALTYLVAAGVGRVGLIDPDVVSPSNLNRQFLYCESDIGRPKAAAAKERLTALNSEVDIVAHQESLSAENAEALLAGYGLVVGAVDSYDTRLVINKAAASLGLPYIDGGVNGFNGYVAFSHPPETPCLNCVFINRGADKSSPGVLGTTAGVIGALEANLALLWLLGHDNPIRNKLLLYDGARMKTDLAGVSRDKNCPVCGS